MSVRSRLLGLIEVLLLVFLFFGALLVDVSGVAALTHAAPSATDPGSVTASYAIGIVLLVCGLPLTYLVLQALGFQVRHGRKDDAPPAKQPGRSGPPWARDWQP